MRSGTPGFVGDRLREARDVRGLTATSLAEIVNVSPQAISQYERGRNTPSPDVLSTIADVTNFPITFFTLPERTYERGPLFYRSMSSTTKAARRRSERRFAWVRDIVQFLSHDIEFPEPNFPDLRLPEDPLLLSDQEIDNAAESLRSYWGMDLGPVPNMVALLENHGAIVARDRMGAETLDGLSEKDPIENRPYVFIGTDKGSPPRWRFDAAHELGHVVLHSSVDRSTLNKASDFKRIETQAHRFAASFLLPLESFGEELLGLNLDALVALKPRWGVSVAMMIRRCLDAGFFPPDDESFQRRFWINYSRRGWRKAEPFDDSLPIERPGVMRKAIELHVEMSGDNGAQLISSTGLPPSDIENLAGLERGYFDQYAPVAIRQLPRALTTSETNVAEQSTPAEVVQLKFRRSTT